MAVKEFPGGAVPEGCFSVPTEWIEGEAQAVRVSAFEFDRLDTEAAGLRELLARCGTDAELEAALDRIRSRARWDHLVEGFKTALSEIAPGPDMERRWWVLCFTAGMDLTLGVSGPEIASRLGISKQAFFQDVERFSARLGRRILRLNMRDDTARENMRKRNYRKRA